jgi:NAD(P)-dependent dehydrogenase (short-subunit alcohol dehydrogenase family)
MMVPPMSAPAASSLLAGRHALVTGAAGGMGAAIVDEFRRHGATVTPLDVRAAPGVAACDATDEEAVAAAFAACPRLDDVVHAVGTLAIGEVADTSIAELRRVLDVNLISAFVVAREAARRLGAGGTLTLIASQAGRKGGAGWAAYCASKFGVIGLGESLAQELAPAGVRVNTVCPGTIDSAMTESALARLAALKGTSQAEERERYEHSIPLRRFGRPDEVASACVLLASPLASFVAGASLVVDGGELS